VEFLPVIGVVPESLQLNFALPPSSKWTLCGNWTKLGSSGSSSRAEKRKVVVLDGFDIYLPWIITEHEEWCSIFIDLLFNKAENTPESSGNLNWNQWFKDENFFGKYLHFSNN